MQRLLSSTGQTPLPSDPPGGWDPNVPTEKYELSMRKGIFYYRNKPNHHTPNPNGRKSPDLDIVILGNRFIEIELDSNFPWHWAFADAITTEVGTVDCFALEYYTSHGWDSDSNDESCKLIRFGVRRVSVGPGDNPHPFNMNVEIESGTGVIPFTIDPDIRNPGTTPIPMGAKFAERV
jgi:hypothetical protein